MSLANGSSTLPLGNGHIWLEFGWEEVSQVKSETSDNWITSVNFSLSLHSDQYGYIQSTASKSAKL